MKIRGSERYCRRILNFDMQVCRRWQNSVERGGVSQCIAGTCQLRSQLLPNDLTVLPLQREQSLPDALAASSGGERLSLETRASRLLAADRGCQDWILPVVFEAARKYVE